MLFKSLIKKILDKLLPSKLAIAEKTEITEMLVDMQKRVEQGTEKIDQNFLTSIADLGANTRGTFVPLQIKNIPKKILRELPEDQGEALINEIQNRYASEINIPLIRLVEEE